MKVLDERNKKMSSKLIIKSESFIVLSNGKKAKRST
jgi:hypothetical protein